MNTPAPAHVLRFGVFELDIDSGELRRHGLKIRLPDQSFQILKGLLSRPGEVVTREELRRVLWSSDTFVEFEVGLNSAVRKLREALDDSADNPRFVDTVPRRGYRFIAPVSVPAVEVVRVQVQVQASPADAPPFAPASAAAACPRGAAAKGRLAQSVPRARASPRAAPRRCRAVESSRRNWLVACDPRHSRCSGAGSAGLCHARSLRLISPIR
jgi:DNA-binding winged helix-turn-helix (wHTH) protein